MNRQGYFRPSSRLNVRTHTIEDNPFGGASSITPTGAFGAPPPPQQIKITRQIDTPPPPVAQSNSPKPPKKEGIAAFVKKKRNTDSPVPTLGQGKAFCDF